MHYLASIELWLFLSSSLLIGAGILCQFDQKRLAGISNVMLVAVFALHQFRDGILPDQFIDNIAGIYGLFVIAACALANLFFISVKNKNFAWEYLPLNLLNLLGGFVVLRSDNLLTLFLGLEIQALVCYILCSFLHDSYPLASEASVKYFSLGAINTCITLFGISFIYGFVGSVNYSVISSAELNLAARLGICLVILGLLFKLAAAPLHTWMLDVYQESSIFALSTFMSISKVTALLALIIVLRETMHSWPLERIVIPILQFSAALSLFIGCFGALRQENFKRFLAYNGVFNISYVLMSLSLLEYNLALMYLMVYSINSLLVLSILASSNIDVDNLEINHLSKLKTVSKSRAFFLGISILSFIGIPPLVGFSAKYYVLYSLFVNNRYLLVLLGLLTTLVTSFYYLRIIKVLFFDKYLEESIPSYGSSSYKLYDLINICGAGFILFGWSAVDVMLQFLVSGI
ncbi:NADH dehydrogenase subunit N [Candidatus Phycorickettsia trachydisci]|uniref:NADH dehydrogenase subunit N n=1 Tax=Candidatus Phycorickettsia trachydisci TaxID=2115978 RepID=A0A2P1P8F3_9RICK|nr:proton-conducting transporter membrane subunit [Candidatus Phycorickettsia trachydisci]AVP87549.1 NADH dehydrogenase subunit N [Candidatus Phycorickettsia trachydisci]